MDITKKVKQLMLEKDMNVSKLAKAIGTSQPNLHKKLQNNSLSVSDLEKIAEALGVEFELNFILENGERI